MREDAFGIVKGRFRILKSVINVNMNDLPTVIYACFVLHNFLQVQNESLKEYLERDCEVQRRTYNRNRNETEQESGMRINERAKAIRNVFVKYFRLHITNIALSRTFPKRDKSVSSFGNVILFNHISRLLTRLGCNVACVIKRSLKNFKVCKYGLRVNKSLCIFPMKKQ